MVLIILKLTFDHTLLYLGITAPDDQVLGSKGQRLSHFLEDLNHLICIEITSLEDHEQQT